ncbi:MAG: CBS domain-containing protein [Gemmatimonadales bacterium]
MQVQELMTKDPVFCTPDQPVGQAAALMEQHDCGCLPVEELGTRKLVGVITDRDIALRVVGTGCGPETLVRDAMSEEPSCCGPEDEVDRVERIMSTHQVRRVPVVSKGGRVVGIVAQADLARAAEKNLGVSEGDVARVVESVSRPNGHADKPASGPNSKRPH